MNRFKELAVPALILAVFLILLLAFANTALADDWTRVGNGGMQGTYNQVQSDAKSSVVLGTNLYVGTTNYISGCEIWRYDGTSWVQVNIDGFGDRHNVTALSMAVSGSDLYVAAQNDTTGCEVWRYRGASWAQVNADGFGTASNTTPNSMAIFNSSLYVGVYNNSGCGIWKTALVGGPPFTDWVQVNASGFGDTNTKAARCMTVFNSCLFVGGYNFSTGCEIWRTAAVGGPPYTDWVQVNANGFGVAENMSASSMAVFNSRLYVGVQTYSTFCEVWASGGTGGPPFTDWAQVNTNGFGDVQNVDTGCLTTYGGYLYAGTQNWVTGAEVWRTAGVGGPPYTDWQQVNADAFGTGVEYIACCMAVYDSALFVGTHNNWTGCSVWKTSAAGGPPYTDWARTNDGVFTQNNNYSVLCMAEFNGELYAGTESRLGCRVLRYNGSSWVPVNANGFGDSNNLGAASMAVKGSYLYVGTYNTGGCEIWRTAAVGGPPYTDWQQVNSNGFGDSNESADSMTVFGSRLYVGTRRSQFEFPFQRCEVWATAEVDGPPYTDWAQVNSDGFGQNSISAPSMATFNSYLYVSSSCDSGCQIWRTAGVGGPPYTDWQQVNSNGFGDFNNRAAPSMAVFGSSLYVGTSYGSGGCQVWGTAGVGGPPFTDWAKVNSNGFGDSNNTSASSMAVCNSRIYIGTYNGSTGCEIWSSAGSGGPPFTDWGQANSDGFGDADNTNAMSMLSPGTYAYVGTYNQIEGCEVQANGGPVPPPTVTSITPNAGTNSGPVSITDLAGTGFLDSPPPTVRLEKTGRTDIVASNVARVSPTRLTCDLGLAGAASGAWDVHVENNDGRGATLAAGFTVNNPAPTVTSITPGYGTQGAAVGVTNLAGTGFYGAPVVRLKKTGQATITATAVSVVSATRLTCMLNIPAQAALGAWSVEVTNPDSQAVTRTGAFTVTAAPSPQSTWYMAEGSTASPFSTYISIANPNTTTVHAAITYLTGTGQVSGGTVTLPAKSQATVNPVPKVGSREFSTRVICSEGKAICCDRTMSWTGPGASGPEAHSSVGVTTPAKTWYLPEGSSAWGFTCKLALMNPNAASATVTLTYMIEGSAAVSKTKTVGAWRRATFDMAGDIGSKDASIKVTSNLAVVPERSMYRNNTREGHCSIGTVAPASDYYLAEGTSAWGFTTYVLVQNPNSSTATVNVTFMTADGPVTYPAFSMAANSRKTLRVNDFLPGKDFSTRVHGSKPIIAERSMYWDSPAGEACHDSIGLASPHPTFWLADGQSSNGRETWTLVQNPNSSPVSVQVTYMTPTGAGNRSLTETIPANSRKTFSMANKIPSGRAAIVVTCKTTGKKIMVERAMYWAGRAAGTDTIGGYSN